MTNWTALTFVERTVVKCMHTDKYSDQSIQGIRSNEGAPIIEGAVFGDPLNFQD